MAVSRDAPALPFEEALGRPGTRRVSLTPSMLQEKDLEEKMPCRPRPSRRASLPTRGLNLPSSTSMQRSKTTPKTDDAGSSMGWMSSLSTRKTSGTAETNDESLTMVAEEALLDDTEDSNLAIPHRPSLTFRSYTVSMAELTSTASSQTRLPHTVKSIMRSVREDVQQLGRHHRHKRHGSETGIHSLHENDQAEQVACSQTQDEIQSHSETTHRTLDSPPLPNESVLAPRLPAFLPMLGPVGPVRMSLDASPCGSSPRLSAQSSPLVLPQSGSPEALGPSLGPSMLLSRCDMPPSARLVNPPADTLQRRAHTMPCPETELNLDIKAEIVATRCWDMDTTLMPAEDMAAWLGGSSPLQKEALSRFTRRFDLRGYSVLDALRALCARLYLRGDANRIDVVLLALSERYKECNAPSLFRTADNVHRVLYSLFLLNTDLHVADVAQHMTQTQFVDNTISTLPGAARASVLALRGMYASVREEPLGVPSNLVPQRSLRRALTKSATMLRIAEQSKGLWNAPGNSQHDTLRTSRSEVSLRKQFASQGMEGSLTLTDPWRIRRNTTCQATLDHDSLVLRTSTNTERLSLLHAFAAEAKGIPNELVLHLANGNRRHLTASSATEMQRWINACNLFAARVSRVPLYGACTNQDYGWAADAAPAAPAVRGLSWLWRRPPAAIAEWVPPSLPMGTNTQDPATQYEQLDKYAAYLRSELALHGRAKAIISERWSYDAHYNTRALSNWTRRRAHLARELNRILRYIAALATTSTSQPQPPPSHVDVEPAGGARPRIT